MKDFVLFFLFVVFALSNSLFCETIAVPYAYVIPEKYSELSKPVTFFVLKEIMAETSQFEVLGPEKMDYPYILQKFYADPDIKVLQNGINNYDYLCAIIVDHSDNVFEIRSKLYSIKTGTIISEKIQSSRGSELITAELAKSLGNEVAKDLNMMVSMDNGDLLLELPPETSIRLNKPAKRKGYSHIIFTRIMPWFGGTSIDSINSIHDSHFGKGNYSFTPVGYELNITMDLLNSFYLGYGLAMFMQNFETNDGSYSEKDYSVTDLHFCGGILLPLHKNIAAYAGVGLSVLSLTSEDYWEPYNLEYESENGIGVYTELGIDIVFGPISISSILSYTYSNALSESYFFTNSKSLGIAGISLGAGLRY